MTASEITNPPRVSLDDAIDVLIEYIEYRKYGSVYSFAWDLKRTFGETEGWPLYLYYSEDSETEARNEWDSTDATAPHSEWDIILADQKAHFAHLDRVEEIEAKPFKERTEAERFYHWNGREHRDADELARWIDSVTTKQPTEAEWLEECREHRSAFLEAREFLLGGNYQHVIDALAPEHREWLLSGFDPEPEFHLSDRDRWPNVQRMNATIKSAKWLREMNALDESVAAVALTIEIEVKRSLLGIGK